MKWTEEVDKRIEWINKRTPLTELQVGYIEFQMFELLKLHEKVVKNNVGLANVVGQSEQLKAEVFKLANKLAVAGEGDAAVAMHRIHNRL